MKGGGWLRKLKLVASLVIDGAGPTDCDEKSLSSELGIKLPVSCEQAEVTPHRRCELLVTLSLPNIKGITVTTATRCAQKGPRS